MKRVIRYSFICLLSIFLMSHNAFAVDLSEEVYYVNGGQGALYMTVHTGGAWGSWNNGTYSLGQNETIDMVRIRRQDNTNISDLQVGDYITYGMLYSLGGTSSKWNTTGTYYLGNSTVDNGVSCPIVDIDDTVVSNHADSSNTSQRHNAFITCRIATTSTQPTLNLQIRSINNTNGTAVFSFRTFTHWRPQSNRDYSSDLNTIKEKLIDLNAKGTINNEKLDDINDSLQDIKDNQDKEENTANENVEQNETDSNQSSSDAEDASQSLISAIGSFVSAITSASPSNCRIDGDMGKVDMGQVDLCANPVPTYMQVISSLILICICIPFAIIMFNRFIALFRSFQS